MKNYYLISGGFIVGMSVRSLLTKEDKENEGKVGTVLSLLAGVGITLVGIYGFNK